MLIYQCIRFNSFYLFGLTVEGLPNDCEIGFDVLDECGEIDGEVEFELLGGYG